MYPVPPQDFLDILYREHGVKVVAAAGCVVCNYENVFADVVNALLPGLDRKHASECVDAHFRGKAYNGYWSPD